MTQCWMHTLNKSRFDKVISLVSYRRWFVCVCVFEAVFSFSINSFDGLIRLHKMFKKNCHIIDNFANLLNSINTFRILIREYDVWRMILRSSTLSFMISFSLQRKLVWWSYCFGRTKQINHYHGLSCVFWEYSIVPHPSHKRQICRYDTIRFHLNAFLRVFSIFLKILIKLSFI